MSECTNPISNWPNYAYGTFKTKGPNKDYVSSENRNTDTDSVCHKRFYIQKGPGGEDAIKKICDKLSYCKGYYKDDTNSVYIVSDKDPDGDTDYDCLSDGDDGPDGPDDIVNYNFPSFYKNKTQLICKQ